MPAAVSALSTPSESALPCGVAAGPPEPRRRSNVSAWLMSALDCELDPRCDSRFVPGAGTKFGMYELVVVVVGGSASTACPGAAAPAGSGTSLESPSCATPGAAEALT